MNGDEEEPKKLKIDEEGSPPPTDDWEARQNSYNDRRMQDATLAFPIWYITSKKVVRPEHSLLTGRTDVIMETLSTDKNNIQLKLNVAEWEDFESKIPLIKDFINAVEGIGDKKAEEVLAYWKIEKYKGSSFCAIRMSPNIKITFSWKDNDDTCSVDIRRCENDIIDAEQKYWKSTDSGMYLTAPSCKYLLKLMPNISAAIKMYSDMHSKCHDLFLSLFSYPISEARYCPPHARHTQAKFVPIEDEIPEPF